MTQTHYWKYWLEIIRIHWRLYSLMTDNWYSVITDVLTCPLNEQSRRSHDTTKLFATSAQSLDFNYRMGF